MQSTVQHFRELIADELDDVSRELAGALASNVEVIPEVYEHILAGGGKRIRPALVVLSARCVAGDRYAARVDRPLLVQFAAAVEMIHLASLLHDDVVDNSGLRRGRTTANTQWHNKLCVFTADFLFAAVYVRLCKPHTADLVRELSCTVQRMSEGEILQTMGEGNLSLSAQGYLQIVNGKTASLMGTGAVLGGSLAGADGDRLQALRAFGEHVGTAFQITDDILDLRGNVEQMGKEPGDDLRGGRLTLPTIFALQSPAAGKVRERVMAFLGCSETIPPDELAGMVDLLRSTGAFDQALALARERVDLALGALETLPDNESREALRALAEGTLTRVS